MSPFKITASFISLLAVILFSALTLKSFCNEQPRAAIMCILATILFAVVMRKSLRWTF